MARRGSGWFRTLVHEARSRWTLLLVVACVLGGVPLVVLLNPDQRLSLLGQSVAVGAREPELSLSGPAQLVQIGNTKLDLPMLTVYGPLRPRLSLGPVQRNAGALQALDPATSARAWADTVHTLADGFLTWFAWGAVGMLAVALAGSAVMGCVRMMIVLRRASRHGRFPVGDAVLWRHLSGAIGRMTLVAVAVSLAAWAASGALAYLGTTRGLAKVGSLTELVGTTRVTPSPVGAPTYGYNGAVIGDSRASRVGGPPVPGADAADTACERSADSLAVELGLLGSKKVLNLACSGASIAQGLRGSQPVRDTQVPPQVGLLKQVRGLEFVVVAVGPNDLYWQDFLQYCYSQAGCDDRLTAGEFGYRLAGFDQDYAGLLRDLNDLPDRPKVVIMTSYDPFATDAGADCPDVRGPVQFPGLDQHKIDLLRERNTQLNATLEAGAQKYGFTVARPEVTPLCARPVDGGGPDLQGLRDPRPFHPTAVGELRMAAAAAQALARTQPPPQR
ncbi:GDSL-type esterase/lipase family protein [Pseudonocardia acaciae]|uniref:GDSL-type esterase/lipase family protein n=1 Tax=Pseudonocardia acaciae TaxID=551276 RepID=UPI000688C5D6|nr:GDSL-type esterase/lipase family protein [Pseudonocardia acaciae]